MKIPTRSSRRSRPRALCLLAVILSLGNPAVSPAAATHTIVSLENLARDGAGADCTAEIGRALDPYGTHELTLHLAFFDAAGLGAGVEEVLKQEVREIFADASVRVEWLEPASLAGYRRGYALKVVMLDTEPAAWNLPANAMGTVLGRRFPATAVYLFAPAIRRTLDPANRRPLLPRYLGRAAGKVLVHEIVHVLAPDLPHARWGLMAPSQHRYTLEANRRRLDPVSTRALRLGLLRARSASRGLGGSGVQAQQPSLEGRFEADLPGRLERHGPVPGEGVADGFRQRPEGQAGGDRPIVAR